MTLDASLRLWTWQIQPCSLPERVLVLIKVLWSAEGSEGEGVHCWGNVAATADLLPSPSPASASVPAALWPAALSPQASRSATWRETAGAKEESQSRAPAQRLPRPRVLVG